MSNSSRCAACKHLRRRCSQDCVLAPYFRPNNPQKFLSVHKVFGASNVTKALEQLPENLRADAVETMAYEASLRVQEPVYGCIGIISQLRQQIIETQYEVERTQGEIALCNARQQYHMSRIQSQLGHLAWLNPNQQDEFHYLHEELLNNTSLN